MKKFYETPDFEMESYIVKDVTTVSDADGDGWTDGWF